MILYDRWRFSILHKFTSRLPRHVLFKVFLPQHFFFCPPSFSWELFCITQKTPEGCQMLVCPPRSEEEGSNYNFVCFPSSSPSVSPTIIINIMNDDDVIQASTTEESMKLFLTTLNLTWQNFRIKSGKVLLVWVLCESKCNEYLIGQ